MSTGKNIRIFLEDGTMHGTISAEIINWSGKVLSFPRDQYPLLSHRPEFEEVGVYFLVGANPEDPLEQWVYVGETDQFRVRLSQHLKSEDKGFWTRTLLVYSSDRNLTKSHIKYLESKLCDLLLQSHSGVVLKNGNRPPESKLPPGDRSDMDYFIAQMQIIIPALNFPFLEKKVQVKQQVLENPLAPPGKVFILSLKGTVLATAVFQDGQLVVLKGSNARSEELPSWTSYRAKRYELVKQGVLVPASDDIHLEFLEDTPFESVSAAAAVVLGRNASGPSEWKLQGSGLTFKEWQNQLINQNAGSET